MELVYMSLAQLVQDERDMKNTNLGYNVRRLENCFSAPLGSYTEDDLKQIAKGNLSFNRVLASLRSSGCVAKKWLVVAADFADTDNVIRSVLVAGRCRVIASHASYADGSPDAPLKK